MSLTLTLAVAEILWIAVIATWVLLEKRPPTSTLAWIFGLALVPYFGAFIYFLWGPRKFDRQRREIRQARGIIYQAQSRSPLFTRRSENVEPLVRLASLEGGLPPTTATDTWLFSEGDAFFSALEEAIRNARHHVHLEYYIFSEDRVGTRLVDLLIERARDGVEVRILVDALGSRKSARMEQRLEAAGIRFAMFNPTAAAKLGRRAINFRTHRKIAVIDGMLGFTGGTNIWEEHSKQVMGDRARRDTDIAMSGEVVRGLQHTFFQNWLFASEEEFADADFEKYCPVAEPGQQFVQIIPSGPDSQERAIYSFLLAAMGLASKRIWLTTPYFVPDESLLNAMRIAAARGVDVELIVPAVSDWRLVDAAGQSYHDELIRAGVKIYLYGPALIHAKTAVIDESIGIIGTANLDDRSMKLNFEVVAVCYGGTILRQLADLFAANREGSVLKRTLEANAPFGRRLLQAVARLLSPQL